MKILNTEYRIPNEKYRIPNTEYRMANSVFAALASVDIGKDFKLEGGASGTSIDSIAQFQSVGGLISAWLPNIYVLGGILVLILVIASGLMWIGNAGDIKKIEESQKILTFAIMGFVFLFASYWIIQIVQVLTGIPILNSNL